GQPLYLCRPGPCGFHSATVPSLAERESKPDLSTVASNTGGSAYESRPRRGAGSPSRHSSAAFLWRRRSAPRILRSDEARATLVLSVAAFDMLQHSSHHSLILPLNLALTGMFSSTEGA